MIKKSKRRTLLLLNAPKAFTQHDKTLRRHLKPDLLKILAQWSGSVSRR